MEYFETLIIGGGPAGTAAGISLLKKGKKCCIVDKQSFPRDKTCGGLLSQKTLDILSDLVSSADLTSFYINKTNRISIRKKNKPVSTFDCENDFYLTNRMLFDNLLIEEFKRLGGVIFENELVENIDSLKKVISTKKELSIGYKYLIFADGAKGISNKIVGKKNMGITIEADIPVDLFKFDNHTICIDFGLKSAGYGWIFPKNEYATVGIGCPYKKGENYLKKFKKYLAYCGINKDIPVRIKGANLPYWPNSDDASCQEFNALLVGDAAGMVDALTGEGIYFALKSGMLAAEAIAAEENVLDNYQEMCKPVYKLIKDSHKKGAFFYKYKHILILLAKNKEHKLARFCDKNVAYYNAPNGIPI